MSSPVQHFPSYENQVAHRLRFNLLPFSNAPPPQGGSVANTARVASVVVGEFRDPGENQ